MARYEVRVVGGPDLERAERILFIHTMSVKSRYSVKSAFAHLVRPGLPELKALSVIIEADDVVDAEARVRAWIGGSYELEVADAPGKHKFKVRAIDAAGNVDPSAAKDKFKVVD